MSDTTTPDEANASIRHLAEEEYPSLLALSERLRRFVDWIGRFGSWFIIRFFSVTTLNIKSILALPFYFEKRSVTSSKDFRTVWSAKKEYVRKVTGQGGSYQANKEKRRSESFPWPGSPAESGIGQKFLNHDQIVGSKWTTVTQYLER